MASASLVCDPATSWYTFSYTLSWSNDCEIGKLLSDIPPISVGILLFGISVLFLAIKKASLSAVWLYFSVFLSFTAAILDLSQTLANNTSTAPLTKLREVFFALSIGLRFLFYWSYVDEPRKVPEGKETDFLIVESNHESHSGNWSCLRLPGKLLASSLLVAIAAITALQVVWRIVPQFHRYSNVYATDTAFELLASVLLLLKLLLNTITPNSPNSPLVHTFGECIAPISGLLINIALAVGNLFCFAFTESTLGRFLQAFEDYIIIVFVVVMAFLRHCNTLVLIHTSPKGRTFNPSLSEPDRGSTSRITALVERARISIVSCAANTARVAATEALCRSTRRSLTRVSSWVSSRVSRNRSDNEDVQAKLWEQGEAENARVGSPYTGHTHSRTSLVSLTEEPKDWAGLVHDAAASDLSIFSVPDAQSTGMRSREGSMIGGQILHAFRADVAQRRVPLRLGTSRLSAPAAPVLSPSPGSHQPSSGRAVIMTAPPDSHTLDSPIYGLGGIIRPPAPRPPGETSRDSGISSEELLRQQKELDKSITTLKLFSRRTSASSSSSQVGTPNTDSDVSLSHFPLPSWLTPPMVSLPGPSSRLPSIMRMREDRRARLSAAAVPSIAVSEELLPPPKILAPLADIPSSPRSNSITDSPLPDDNESLSAAVGRPPQFDSGGTQYNVTSFIGGLATPGGQRQVSLEQPWQSTESEINLAAIINGADWKETTPRRSPVPLAPRTRQQGRPALPAKAKLSPLSISARFFQGGSCVDNPVPITTHLQVPTSKYVHAQRSGLALPASPRVAGVISSPKLLPPDGKSDQAPRAFERPRAPPLVFKSYAEYHSSSRAWRVEDADG
ncbi:hypothetical protein PAXRUDRAFT_827075 [Paxillus rubicundulus Ve08.2h10]|uniref:Uncharacterized protein n=1 Tax=Paxillus rubicundulus Ve08.2h10 TaxID=930991 RepID=A0A0D0DYP3_9AGAM|nr:hypothetical protein PAXRUDRAFT_827075 [Paxillus rubicundulus Ve08.2h10]